MEPYEVPRGCLVFGGVPWPCAVATKLWVHEGLEFKTGASGSRKRGAPPDCLVTHHTGGEETPAGLYAVLQERKLGVEFSIYADGTLWQHCDPVYVDTFDAGFFNRRSAGVEIVNKGLAPASSRQPRLEYRARGFTYLRYTAAQMVSYLALCDTFCAALKVPKRIPAHDNLMSARELENFKGVLGHYHLDPQKNDPGTQPFDVLLEAGYVRT